ncbi:MAG: hypothetical protein KJZ85_09390 [Rhodobacteraceae bacterium]|jgi:hypothetical protein|nr:hypothetical protein [Paracoccaceae bacterium]
MRLVRQTLAAATLCLAGTAAPAQDAFAPAFEGLLMEGRIAAAAGAAEARLAARPDDHAARFALGLAQFLSAVEGLGRGLHRHGLANSFHNDPGMLVFGGGVPFLRLPVPDNPDPEPVTYEALRAVLARFVDDLALAEATLATVPDAGFDLPLRVPAIRLDLDGDGAGAETESVAAIFLAVTGGSFSPEAAGWGASAAAGRTPPVGLDQSDAPWLQAYCHLLSALTDVLLAHDWRAGFETAFHDAFPATRLPSSGLRDEERRLAAQLGPEPPDFTWTGERWNHAEMKAWRAWLDTPAGQARAAWLAAQETAMFGTFADIAAFVHLMHWPVVEPARMAAARQHLLRMAGLSRENWRRIRAETDDRREWLPGPHQTNLMPALRITEATVLGWELFLDEFEAVLTGERLVPHWRLAYGRGINLRRMFDEPATFDPLLIAQGSAVLPYVEDGETVSAETVWTILDMLEGGLLGYFIWFN